MGGYSIRNAVIKKHFTDGVWLGYTFCFCFKNK